MKSRTLSLVLTLVRTSSSLTTSVLPQYRCGAHILRSQQQQRHASRRSGLAAVVASTQQQDGDDSQQSSSQQQPDELVAALSADGSISAKAIVTTELVAETSRLQGLGGLAAAALGRAITCTILVADGLKEEETFQVNFRGDGPLRGVLATANGRLEARGYVGNPSVSSQRLTRTVPLTSSYTALRTRLH